MLKEPVAPKNSEEPSGDPRIESPDLITRQDVERAAEEAGGEIREDNGKMLLVYFDDSKKMVSFCRSFSDSSEKPFQFPVATYAQRYGFQASKKENSEAHPEIASVIDFFAKRNRAKVDNYKFWREQEAEKLKVTAMSYPEALAHGAEGGYPLSDGSKAYISPRFVRTITDGASCELAAGSNVHDEYSSVNILGLKKEMGDILNRNFYEWIIIAQSKSNQSSSENARERLGALVDELRGESDEKLRSYMDMNQEQGSVDDYRQRLIADATNYLAFLDRSYDDLDKFIAMLETYK